MMSHSPIEHTPSDVLPGPPHVRGHRRRAYAGLAEAASDLVGNLEIADQLKRIAQRAHALLDADYAAVATLASDGRTIWRAVDGATSSAWQDVVFPAGRGTAGRVVERNAPIVIRGFPTNPEFPPDEFPAHAAEGMRSALGVPLRRAGVPFGAIVVAWRRDVEISDDEILLTQTLADLAAVAIRNAELFAESQERARRLEQVNAELQATQNQLEQQAAELEEHASQAELLNLTLNERNLELDARATQLGIVLDQMADGVVISNAEGDIVRANPAAERLHGRDLTSIARDERSRVLGLAHPDGTPFAPDATPLSRALAGEIVDGADWTVDRPDGSQVRLLGSAAPLRDPSGQITGAVLVMRDITERAQLVEDLRRATSIKERFFAQMSHELRTPINAILGYSTLITDGIMGPVPADVQRMLTRIRISGQHLLELVNDILDISRLEANKVAIEITEFDLSALARDALFSVEPQALAKGLELRVDAPERLTVASDPARVRQILLNLASNAVKFTHAGRVSIDVQPVTADRVAISVADTGVGISPENIERIFEEFAQVGKGDQGTGLGLTISRRLARLLGGDLSASSEFGRGSRFTLTLPVRQAHSQSATSGE